MSVLDFILDASFYFKNSQHSIKSACTVYSRKHSRKHIISLELEQQELEQQELEQQELEQQDCLFDQHEEQQDCLFDQLQWKEEK